MFGIRPKLPVSEEDRVWVENGLDRLSRMLGRRRMLDATVILPDAEHFPDPFDKTSAAAEKMFGRICNYMKVDRSRIEFEIFADETQELSNLLPYWSGGHSGCAGLYQHPENGDSKMVVAIRQSYLEDPLTLVAVLAHELGHVILLGDELIDRTAKDMEPLTDLLTVFLGLRNIQWQLFRSFSAVANGGETRLVYAEAGLSSRRSVWIRFGQVRSRTRGASAQLDQPFINQFA